MAHWFHNFGTIVYWNVTLKQSGGKKLALCNVAAIQSTVFAGV